jgi:hypothetical protein
VSNLPDRPDPAALPDRRLSNRDFEMVIRRAAELQARAAESSADGMSETEVMRIGRELGLSTEHLRRALAETVAGEAEAGFFASLFGPANVRAGRAVRGSPEDVARLMEAYLVEREYLAVLRRFSDRLVFTRATGVTAAMGRATSQIFSRSPPLPVANLEMTVHPFEEGFAFISLATSLRGQRNAAAASSFVGGGSGAAIVGATLALVVAPPAALFALPVLGASVVGGRAYYTKLLENVQTRLESLLDRLEHGELPPPARRWAGVPR